MNEVNTSLTLGQRIHRAGKLASGERAVADYLQRHPEEAAIASAARLGAATGTSDATVIRTVRKLGFEGLSDLKRSLVEHITRRRDPARVLSDRVRRLSGEQHGALHSVINAGLTLLQEVPAVLDDGAWNDAVAAVRDAAQVWVYGIGPSAGVADHLAVSLRRVGKPADAWTATGFGLSDDLLRLRPDHAVVVIAPLRVFREIGFILEHARRAGATSVLLTEATEDAAATAAHTILTLPDSTEGAANEVLAPLAIAHALVLELVAADRGAAVEQYERLNGLRTEIAGTDLDLRALPES